MSSAAPSALLLEQVQLLEGPNQEPVVTTVLLQAGAFSAVVTAPGGTTTLITAAVMQLLGVWFCWRIVTIKV